MGRPRLNDDGAPRGVLTIGTMESRGIVGAALDLRLLARRGVPSSIVVVAVSGQGATFDVASVPVRTIEAQFAALAPREIAAIRIGALVTPDAVACVAANLRRFPGVPVVLDPVAASSRGGALANVGVLDEMRGRLFPLVTIVLPNLTEAAWLVGSAVISEDDLEAAAHSLVALGVRAALVTGGHLAGDPTDVLVDRSGPTRRFTASRLDRDMRGTGCVLAVSLAAELASLALPCGESPSAEALASAVARARETVRTNIAHARRVGDEWVAS